MWYSVKFWLSKMKINIGQWVWQRVAHWWFWYELLQGNCEGQSLLEVDSRDHQIGDGRRVNVDRFFLEQTYKTYQRNEVVVEGGQGVKCFFFVFCFLFFKMRCLVACSVFWWKRSSVEGKFDDAGEKGENWNKILQKMWGNGAQCTYGRFGFRKEHRQFTQEGRHITWEQTPVGSRSGGGS